MRHLATVTLALLLALGTYQAKAATYNVSGTFANGATLTGSMSLNNGLLLSVDLSDSGALPGTGIGIHGDSVICITTICGPTDFAYQEVFTGTDAIDETFDDATQLYSFYFYGGGSYAYLELVFQLIDGGGTILGEALGSSLLSAVRL